VHAVIFAYEHGLVGGVQGSGRADS